LHGDTAFDHLALAIRNYHDAGNTTMMRTPLAILAALLDRLGCHEPAATLAGFTFGPLTAMTAPEIETAIADLRDVLGDQTYESLVRKGQATTTTEIATYAYDQAGCAYRSGSKSAHRRKKPTAPGLTQTLPDARRRTARRSAGVDR
jgi:hypothetical protein